MPLWWSRPLAPGDTGRDVEVVQRKLALRVTGVFDESTAIALRGAQRALGVAETGVVDEETAERFGPRAEDGLLPEWWVSPLQPGSEGWVRVLGERDESWLRRMQGQHGLTPDGVIDESTARLLGALGV